jgi:ribosomal protein S18 acetylase RimI-like enzyme
VELRIEELTIESALPTEQRQRAAEIIYEAFGRKFDPWLGKSQHSVALFSAALQPDRVLVARYRGELVGLAGLQYLGRKSLVYRWADVEREFGWLTGLPRFGILHFLSSSCRPGELLVEHLSVAGPLRGQGVGRRLLEAAFALARANGLGAVRLEVVDTNPHARRLYERLGFQPAGTINFPLFRVAGFNYMTEMVKPLDGGAS